MTTGAPARGRAAEAEARARAWSLLAEALVRGPEPALRPDLRRSPSLAAALDAAVGTSDDDLAAAHQRVVGFEVPPFAGLFLDPDGLAGGPSDAAFADLAGRCGLGVDPGAEGAGHLAVRFRVLAHLAGAECDAREDDRPAEVERLAALQREVHDVHLLPAFVPWCAAVARVDGGVTAAVAAQALDLALLEREALGDPVPEPADAAETPDAVPDVADPDTGLADLAAYLARPARCGVLYTRVDIATAGRSGDVPRGFGERAVLLENLLRSGAHLDALDEVLASLDGVARDHDTALAGAGPAAAAVAPARRRIAATRDLLAAVRSRAATADGDGQ